LIAAAAPQPSAAQGGAGLGVIVGEPTGLSAKAWVGGNTAVDAAAAWSFEGEDALHLHGDVLQHAFNVFDMQNGALPVYYGIGARLKVEDDRNLFGLRVPLGLAYIFPSSRADIFMEVAPLVDLAPDTDVKINGAAGVRYFFQ
jgi:hypothetical protein